MVVGDVIHECKQRGNQAHWGELASIDKEHLPKLMLWTFSCYPPSAYSHDLGKAHGMCCPAERWSYGIHPPTLW